MKGKPQGCIFFSIIGATMGSLLTIFIIFLSPFMGFLPAGIKFTLVPTEYPARNIDYKQGEGYVQDSETAIKVAEAVLLKIYGDSIYDEKPFVAKLDNDIWTVQGTLQFGSLGGTAVIKISKKDGKILEVYHGK